MPQKLYKQQLTHYIFVSLLSPALAITTLFRTKNYHFILVGSVLSMGLFGLFFTYPSFSDGGTHLERSLRYYSNMSFYEFFSEFNNIIFQNPTYSSEDLYIHILSFFSNSILGLPKTMHFFAGLLLGFVIFKSLWRVMGEKIYHLTWKNGLIFLTVLLFIHSVHSLNAIRISTAMWVCFYGVVSYYQTRNFKYLFVIILASQIHLGYAIIAIPAFVAVYISRYKVLLIIVWILSFSYSLEFDPFKGYLPETEVSELKSKQYFLDDEMLQLRMEQRLSDEGNWYSTRGPEWYHNIAIPGLLILMLPVYLSKKIEPIFKLLVGMALTTYILSNLVGFSPSLQGRIFNLTSISILFAALTLSVSYILNFNYWFLKLWNLYKILFLILCIPYIMKNISHIMGTTDVFFFIGSVATLFFDQSYSLREIIGDII